MREFRIWCKNKNEWEKHTCYLAENGTLFQVVGGNLISCKSETHIVQFYTGLRDKNNKKIFEGDIIIIYPGNFCEWSKKIGKIIWEFASFWIRFPNSAIILDNHDCSLEIIGNIYENPELLENK